MTEAETIIPLSVGRFKCEDAGHDDYEPKCPADLRTEPHYIDSDCPDCGEALVLSDEHRPSGDTDALVAPEVWDERQEGRSVIWYDEWVCPECENGLHMDWPEAEEKRVIEEGGTFRPL